MDLYHFTCGHRADGIRDAGVVIPGHHLRHAEGLATTAIPWSEFEADYYSPTTTALEAVTQ